MKFNEFKTNAKKEQLGVWVNYGSDFKMLLARWNNPKCQKYMEFIGKPYVHQIRHNTLDNKIAEEMIKKSIAKHCLLDWKNLQDETGEDILYSEEMAFELLEDSRDFYNTVYGMCQDMNLFKDEVFEDSVGN